MRIRGSRVEGSFENEPMAFGRLLVAITRTFFLCLSLSSCVRSAFTTFVLCGCLVRWRGEVSECGTDPKTVRGFRASHGGCPCGGQRLHFVWNTNLSHLTDPGDSIPTYQNHNEAVTIFNHLHYAPEKSLN